MTSVAGARPAGIPAHAGSGAGLAGTAIDVMTERTMLAAMARTADHVPRNRAAWDRWAAEYAGPGLRNWAAAEPAWGI